jgi:hypothetical protein
LVRCVCVRTMLFIAPSELGGRSSFYYCLDMSTFSTLVASLVEWQERDGRLYTNHNSSQLFNEYIVCVMCFPAKGRFLFGIFFKELFETNLHGPYLTTTILMTSFFLIHFAMLLLDFLLLYTNFVNSLSLMQTQMRLIPLIRKSTS